MFPSGISARERKRLFAGLTAFVNAGGSQQEYEALAATWPTFWPHATQPPPVNEHARFLSYRDTLRRVWRGGEKKAEEQAFLHDLAYLLGLIPRNDTAFFIGLEAVGELREASRIVPIWGSGDVRYIGTGDFETALWLLSRESWRAKVCGECGRYFIATKPAESYCSPECQNEAKRKQRLEWWNKAGKFRRAQARSNATKKSSKRKSR
jgi:hypothetical protein